MSRQSVRKVESTATMVNYVSLSSLSNEIEKEKQSTEFVTKLPDKAPEGSRKRPRESSFLQKKENVVISSYRSYSQFKKRILSA